MAIWVPSVPRPTVRNSVLIAPFNDTKTTARILQEHGSSIAAVIVEPLQRIIKPRGTFLQDVRRLTKDLNIVYIFDEVVTGFRLDYGGEGYRCLY